MASFHIVIIVAIVFGFVYSVVKMGIEHSEKLERMKHGYPLKDGTVKKDKHIDVIDYRGGNNTDGYNNYQQGN